ncbi:hypothetical protein JDN40_01815 [Rhodomicrobium vannielii ATCC 17100]|uniref:hypothetical protein n=1 Tax=Rhodomicrobium vannielii TaxID=1069 RepID=UPI001918C31E|nr:hypothetical protein [Rhodomicrobium vannielii]MBJ7532854.1 hypothetical protein [Rhodomicrobium vannielii ATCC 17100]
MTDIAATLDASATLAATGQHFKPFKPHRWTSQNTPATLRLVPDREGVPVIPRDDLDFLLNASARDLLIWRYDPRFPVERRCAYPEAAGYRPDELIAFLKTRQPQDQARVCPLLPLGPVNAMRRRWLRPTRLELLISVGVAAVSAILSFQGIMAVAL